MKFSSGTTALLLSAAALQVLAQAVDFGSYSRDCSASGGTPYKEGRVFRCNFNSSHAADMDAAEKQAQDAAAEEAQRARAQQQRQEASRKAKEAADRQFMQDRDAAAATLKGSSSAAPEALRGLGTDPNSLQLKGSSSPTPPVLKGGEPRQEARTIPCPTVTDSATVDACKVPTGLPKAVEKAITTVYGAAPAGVSDRLRKGFQAVMQHDWKVAKAWFDDALQHDPGNARLQRLAALSAYTQDHIALAGTQNAAQAARATGSVQAPSDADLELLFPGWQAAPTSATGAEQKGMVQRPMDSDLQFLFPDQAFPSIRDRMEAKKLNDLMLGAALKATEYDPVLVKVSRRVPPGQGRQAPPPDIHN